MIQNKHIIRLSFIGLFLNIIANIVMYRYFMIEEVVLKQVSDNNNYLVQAYQREVWDVSKDAILKFNNIDDKQQLLADVNFVDYIQNSLRFFRNVNSVINIYSKNGNRVMTNSDHHEEYDLFYSNFSLYSSIIKQLDAFFLSNYMPQNPINDAYKGKTSHSLVARVVVKDTTLQKSFIKSYIPLISAVDGKFQIEGIVEIKTDITDQWEDITYLEKRAIIIFVIIFLIFFVIVMYNTNYAQTIINKQFETNRALKEAKTKAETESSAKTEFLANISHELRTPLNAIIGFSEIIMSETYGKIANPQYQDYINDINNSGKHLLSVINDILDFSKAAADKLKVENVELDLNKLASSSMRFVKPRADASSIQLVEEMPQTHVVIVADPKRLKQALLNLLSNAVKFTNPGGTVTLSIIKNTSKQVVDIRVIDNGIGMDESEIPKALSSFGQVDNRLSRKYEGTGLGLPLTKKLVELMGGNFSIESKKDQGTKVTISFKYDDLIQL